MQQSQSSSPYLRAMQQSQSSSPYLRAMQQSQSSSPYLRAMQQSQSSSPYLRAMQQSQSSSPYLRAMQQSQSSSPYLRAMQQSQSSSPYLRAMQQSQSSSPYLRAMQQSQSSSPYLRAMQQSQSSSPYLRAMQQSQSSSPYLRAMQQSQSSSPYLRAMQQSQSSSPYLRAMQQSQSSSPYLRAMQQSQSSSPYLRAMQQSQSSSPYLRAMQQSQSSSPYLRAMQQSQSSSPYLRAMQQSQSSSPYLRAMQQSQSSSPYLRAMQQSQSSSPYLRAMQQSQSSSPYLRAMQQSQSSSPYLRAMQQSQSSSPYLRAMQQSQSSSPYLRAMQQSQSSSPYLRAMQQSQSSSPYLRAMQQSQSSSPYLRAMQQSQSSSPYLRAMQQSQSSSPYLRAMQQSQSSSPYLRAMQQSQSSSPYLRAMQQSQSSSPYLRAMQQSQSSSPYLRAMQQSQSSSPYLRAMQQSQSSSPYLRAMQQSQSSSPYLRAMQQSFGWLLEQCNTYLVQGAKVYSIAIGEDNADDRDFKAEEEHFCSPWKDHKALHVALEHQPSLTSINLDISNRCDKKTLINVNTVCQSCTISKEVDCLAGYLKKTQGIGNRDCRYIFTMQNFSLSLPGCSHVCAKEFLDPHCCPGYWGSDCMECPGGAATPCSNRGNCSEGVAGNGTCSCSAGFGGTACERCAEENVYGSDCNSVCECLHGLCNSGITGDGKCTCFSGYRGPKCDQPIRECAALECPDKARCIEDAVSGKLVCKCLPDHEADGKNCKSINPCLKQVCHQNANCAHLGPNQHQCTCHEGYQGDGQVCMPVDPCQISFGNCPPDSSVCIYDGPGKMKSLMDNQLNAQYLSKLHVIAGELNIETLKKSDIYYTLTGKSGETVFSTEDQQVKIRIHGSKKKGNILQGDIVASNGLIHIVSKLMDNVEPTVESEKEENLMTILADNGKFNRFRSLLQKFNVAQLLEQPGPYTVFAPTNGALESMDAGTLEYLLSSEAKCIKTGPGTHICQCLVGWRADGDECQEINNCMEPNRGGCHENANCIYIGPGQATCKYLSPGTWNCVCQEGFVGDGKICYGNVATELSAIPDAVEFNKWVNAAEIYEILSEDTNRTVFVPSESAIEKMNKEDKDFWTSNGNLPSLIKYHMVLGIYKLGDLQNLSSSSVLLTSLHRNSLHVSKRNEASPLRQCDGNQYSLAKEIEGSSAFTVFVPSNNVIESFLKENGSTTLDENHIRYHIVLSEKLKKQDLQNGIHKETMLGFSYQLGFFLRESQLFVNDAQVNYTDVETSRGVIHGLGKVLQVQRNRCDQKTSTNTQVPLSIFLDLYSEGGPNAGSGAGPIQRWRHWEWRRALQQRQCKPRHGGHTRSSSASHDTGHSRSSSAGHDTGHTRSSSAGHDMGHTRSSSAGHDTGHTHSSSAGHDTGHTRSSSAGHDTGHTRSSSVGHDTGHTRSSSAGHDTGHTRSSSAGHDTGHTRSSSAGHDTGHTRSSSAGHDTGHTRSSSAGHDTGHTRSSSAGHDTGHTRSSSAGHDTGHTRSSSAGHDTGHTRSSSAGHDTGHTRSSSAGHDTGHARSSSAGHDTGHARSSSAGHDTGHARSSYTICCNPVTYHYYLLSFKRIPMFVFQKRDCCTGFFGAQCESCPRVAGRPCFGNGICQDGVNGTGVCICKQGFTGTACENCETGKYGPSCDQALDACESSNGGCSPKALCKRTTPGKRVCVCNAGYTGDGVVCLEINPCLVNNGGCHLNAECTHTGPSQANVVRDLAGQGPFTVFVPSSDAFKNEANIKQWDTRGLMPQILRYHMVACSQLQLSELNKTKTVTTLQGELITISYSQILAADLPNSEALKTLQGSDLHVNCGDEDNIGALFLNNRKCRIVQRQLEFSGGIAHGIDCMLAPPSVGGRCDTLDAVELMGDCGPCYKVPPCPTGSKPQKTTKNCVYSLLFKKSFDGCQQVCSVVIWRSKCCPGYFGVDCQAVTPVCSPSCSTSAVCKENNTCECKPFYEGDGRTCTVVNLCQQQNGRCAKEAHCTQKGVAVTCSCPKGYSGDGYTCVAIDPCVTDNGECHEHATCTMTGPNKRMCECKSGYIGDGEDCAVKELPINRCAQNNGQCHTDAICTDLHFEDSTVGVFLLRSPQGQYKLVYEAAKEGCRQKGATIATYNQLSYAQQAGFHMCAAGWLAAERVAYPTAYSNPKCGFGQVGIVDYKVRSNLSETWDAYCYRMKNVQCACKPGYIGDGYSCSGNLLQVLTVNPIFSNFLSQILTYSNNSRHGEEFVNRLSNLTIQATLFVPDNSALNENETLSERDIEYHLSDGNAIYFGDLTNGSRIPTLLGHSLLISDLQNPSINSTTRYVNDRYIIDWDILAANGIIHVIQEPLQAPPPKPALHASHKAAIGVGLFLTVILIGLVGFAAYHYYSRRSRPFQFHYFKSDEGEDVAPIDVNPSICNPMYEAVCSPHSRDFDAVTSDEGEDVAPIDVNPSICNPMYEAVCSPHSRDFDAVTSDEGEDVAPIDVNPSICNPMYEAVCSPHSRDFDAVTDKHQVANSGPYDLLQDS
ncbi:UNVERIFIED_CONTAM: hypothetical protein FKN15_040379 [Acipenser sinensis]